jgi:hypothetical protein
MDALDENRDNGPQISINRVTAGPIHGMTKHSCMDGIAKNIHSTAEIDFGINVSRFSGCLEAFYQG